VLFRVSADEHRYQQPLARLAAQAAHQHARLVAPVRGHCGRLACAGVYSSPVWTIALVWMGMACMLNARRCGRTHCRYTGPYYLAMIAPVVVLGSGFVSVGIYAWLLLACVILLGSLLLWWATERAWGEFSR